MWEVLQSGLKSPAPSATWRQAEALSPTSPPQYMDRKPAQAFAGLFTPEVVVLDPEEPFSVRLKEWLWLPVACHRGGREKPLQDGGAL